MRRPRAGAIAAPGQAADPTVPCRPARDAHLERDHRDRVQREQRAPERRGARRGGACPSRGRSRTRAGPRRRRAGSAGRARRGASGRSRRRARIREAQRRSNRHRVHDGDGSRPCAPVPRDEHGGDDGAECAARVLYHAERAGRLHAAVGRHEIGEQCALRDAAERLEEAHRREHGERRDGRETKYDQRRQHRLRGRRRR